MKCKFCDKNEATTKILDGETLQDIEICKKCFIEIKGINK